MERIFTFLIGSFVVLHNLSPVTPAAETLKGNVVFWSQHTGGNQVIFPYAKPDEVVDQKTAEIKLTENTKLKIECKDYKKDEPKAFLYTPEGILLDILILAYRTQVCDKIENYVFVSSEPKYDEQNVHQVKLGINFQELAITYLMAGKIPRCMDRKYIVVDFPYMANVIGSDYHFVDCPDKMKTIAESGASAGGVLQLSTEHNHDMEYNKDVASVGDTKEFIFDTKDAEGKSYKFKCTEYTLKKELAMTKEKRMATASIIREHDEQIIIDRFILQSCEPGVQGININKAPGYRHDHYRIVFKLVDGKCMERDIVRYGDIRLYYYAQIFVKRGNARKVRCPKKWSGDIGLNENVPFWKIMYKRKPFFMTW